MSKVYVSYLEAIKYTTRVEDATLLAHKSQLSTSSC